ncbi:MAG: 3-carboxy-cis,cis-muconate cycloisomerase [Janthinobacterium lividum]
MHALSGRLTDALFSTEAALAIWSPENTVQGMLDVEAALTHASAAAGVVPASAVAPIAAACKAEQLDLPALAMAAALAGNLAIPLVKQLTARVQAQDEQAAKFVHWGATSQDIIDTGLVLQCRATLDLLGGLLASLSAALARQAQAHRATPMVGRTWLQQALPITLGLKFAQWLDAALRHRQRLAEIRQRVCMLQFGGAAGTLASLGAQAPAVARGLADALGLGLPDVPWHSQRDRIAELAGLFGLVIGSMGKIARDVSLMMQTEIGELAEPAAAGKGGSSTMPHKRNPVGSAAVLAAAVRAPGLVATVFAGMVQEHERALGGWQAEWEALPDLARLACGAVSQISGIVEGLEVDVARLSRNLDLTHGLILGEAVTLALGETIGRLDAHHLVEQASKQALVSGRGLLDVLSADARVTQHLSQQALAQLLTPANYVGQSAPFVDAVLSHYAASQTAPHGNHGA